MQSYRCRALANLAAQLRRGPNRLRLRQLLNIEFLLSVIEPEKSYPYDFVCHALTGFRPRSGAESNGDTPLLDGDTLIEDLVQLAEELSLDANIPPAALSEDVYSVAELARRFDVSTKTIFRWHRRGLTGWRLRCADRRVRLAFPDRCVRRFVARNASLVARGSAFSQLTPQEREGIIARAQELAAGGERTVNAVARLVAGETGRAVETVRLILKQYDEAHPRSGIFNRSQLEVDADDQRLAVWEAYVDGTSVEALAERFGRPAAWIYATITQMRARELRVRKIEFVDSGEFRSPDADREILEHPALRHPFTAIEPDRRIPADLPPYLRQLFLMPLLTPQGETALFRKMNYLKFKADQARRQIDPETVTATALDQIEELLIEAGRVKNQIVQANLRLVVSIAKRHVAPGQDFFEVVSDGNVSLMRAVDRFDFTRGFKFSTYCSWAIIKNYARTLPEQRLHHDHYQTGRDELLLSFAGPSADEHEDDYLPAVRATLERMLAALDEREQVILRQRYALDGGGEPCTLDQIGQRLGVSKERIRQLEARALAKLRQDFTPQAAHLLGS
jgi:RNA polymerase primary sigma factor